MIVPRARRVVLATWAPPRTSRSAIVGPRCRRHNVAVSRRLNRADVQVALLDSVVLAVACLASYWLTVHLVPHVRPVSKPDDLIGALWAVIATVFVFRDSYQRSLTAAASRIAATSVSFALCLI
jgi:hypothetical protein